MFNNQLINSLNYNKILMKKYKNRGRFKGKLFKLMIMNLINLWKRVNLILIKIL